MFPLRKILTTLSRVTTIVRNYNVTVVGGATDIGQAVCMMLKSEPFITKLTIYDTLEQTPGVALDLSHIPTDTNTKCFTGERNLQAALYGADLVLAIGGAVRTPGMTEELLLKTNANFIRTLCSKIGKSMPFLGIVTEPINTIVPMAAEVLKNHGGYNPKKLFGITGVDSLRAQSVYASQCKIHPLGCYVPVIGGHSEKTMIPLFSKSSPNCTMNEKKIHECTNLLRKADQTITEAKKGYSPSLSTAHSVVIFTRDILHALDGQPAQVQAFIESNDFGTSYFSGLVNVTKDGILDMHRYTNLSPYEFQLLEHSIIQLRKEIHSGRKMLEMA